MNRNELEHRLKDLDINPNQYSLFGELIPDSIILYENYGNWEVFYLDERGARNDEKIFKHEKEACLYIYKLFKEAKEIQIKYNLRS